MFRKLLIGAAALLLAAVTAAPAMASANLITVDSTAGFAPNDGGCTLTEAISNVNDATDHTGGDCASGVSGANEIDFNIGSGAVTLPSSGWEITRADTTIDGTTQPGSCGGPCITLDAAGTNVLLTLSASGITVKGLALIDSTGGSTILLHVFGANNAVIQGNYIGTDGVTSHGSANAILLSGSNDVTIGGTGAANRNLIDGSANGIRISAGSTGTIVDGNWIGLQADGVTGGGNASGVYVLGSGPVTIGNNTGNVIANSTAGNAITFDSGAPGSIVQGNLIGLDSTGAAALGSAGSGIVVSSTDSVTINANVIAASAGCNICVATSDFLVVQNNRIGTNAAGTAALGGQAGITASGSPMTSITGNLVSGNNGNGIQLISSDNSLVQANLIGTNAAGTAALPNSGAGIIVGNSANVLVGGADPLAGNLVSGNGAYGVAFTFVSTGTLRYNRIGTSADGTGAIPNNTDGQNRAGVWVDTVSVVTVADNLVAHNMHYGIVVSGAGSGFGAGSTGNCLLDNPLGEQGTTGSTLTFENNWWNSSVGPNTSSGEKANAEIDAAPFLTTPPPVCNFLYAGVSPVLKSPKENGASTRAKVKFSWKGIKKSTGYVLEVDDDPLFGSPIETPTKKTSASVSGLGYGRYFWRVWGEANGVGGFSPARALDVSIMKSPANGKTLKRVTMPKFAWANIRGATYDLALFSGPGCAAPLHAYPG